MLGTFRIWAAPRGAQILNVPRWGVIFYHNLYQIKLFFITLHRPSSADSKRRRRDVSGSRSVFSTATTTTMLGFDTSSDLKLPLYMLPPEIWYYRHDIKERG